MGSGPLRSSQLSACRGLIAPSLPEHAVQQGSMQEGGGCWLSLAVPAGASTCEVVWCISRNPSARHCYCDMDQAGALNTS
jgi:hypothetical protein